MTSTSGADSAPFRGAYMLASAPRGNYRTFPSRAPVVGLDRIWVHPRECLIETHVDSSAPARLASDHLPLAASIDCGGAIKRG